MALLQQFALPLLAWYQQHGRRDLPWQNPRTPYRVWLSEIMLQQTQVKTVIPYFIRFINRFPDIRSLAGAEEDDVLALWSGLGYYSRGRNLHKTARMICETHNGVIPDKVSELTRLPGIGESTAAAIASLAYNQRTPILDGNVKRVLSRFFLISDSLELTHVKQKLWKLADACMPSQQCADYTQAIMDLGATCCLARNPTCELCPLQQNCQAFLTKQVKNIPKKKEKKIKPALTKQFLLIHNRDNLIFLEKRPPSGIWGGLWCLPSIDENQCARTHLLETYLLHVDEPRALAAFRHGFTHFTLNIKAFSLCAVNFHAPNPSVNGRFFRADEIFSLGLAKPVIRIIQHFINTKKPEMVELSSE